MNYQELSDKIINYVGGQENISGLTHCATRLRFNLKDETKAQTQEIKDTTGVMGLGLLCGMHVFGGSLCIVV